MIICNWFIVLAVLDSKIVEVIDISLLYGLLEQLASSRVDLGMDGVALSKRMGPLLIRYTAKAC